MTQVVKNELRELMVMAWSFVKKNGYDMSEAMKVAWRNMKLRKKMTTRIVRFWFQKVDGSVREAFGTLDPSVMPETQGSGRKSNETVQTYYDTEKSEFRCYKRANLLRIAN